MNVHINVIYINFPKKLKKNFLLQLAFLRPPHPLQKFYKKIKINSKLQLAFLRPPHPFVEGLQKKWTQKKIKMQSMLSL